MAPPRLPRSRCTRRPRALPLPRASSGIAHAPVATTPQFARASLDRRGPCACAPAALQARGVRLVVDATGRFLDPAAGPDTAQGALRGHLAAGAETVVLSAPFKPKDKASFKTLRYL